MKKKEKNKYHSSKVTYDGFVFDSRLEGARYLYLRNLEQKGVIQDLQMQVEYEILPRQSKQIIKHLKTKDKIVEKPLERPVKYKCDFQYMYNGELVVEDVKGSSFAMSRDFPIRKKLMLYMHGIEVRVINSATQPID